MKRTIICIYLISLQPSCFVKSFSEVISPRSIPDGDLTVPKSWLVYVDSNLVNALMTCFYNRKRNYFNQMRTCLMNCSPSCMKMQLYLSPPCLNLVVIQLEQLKQLMTSGKTSWDIYLAFKNVEKYYYSGNDCFFRRNLTVFHRLVDFSTVVGRVRFVFKTDVSLRINITYINFEITLVKCECTKRHSNCRREIYLVVNLVNLPQGSDFKVGSNIST